MKNTPLKGNTIDAPAYLAKTLRTESLGAAIKRFALVAFLALSLGLLTTACKNDTPPPAPNPNSNATSVELSLSALPMQTLGTTRASASMTTAQESRINNVWAVQFDATTGNRVGEPYYGLVHADMQTASTVYLSANLTSQKTAQTLYFITNTNDPTLLTGVNAPANITALNAICQTYTTEYKPTAVTGLPMIARVEVSKVESGTPITGILLERMVAKINLRWLNNYTYFTITNVQLRNVPKGVWLQEKITSDVNYPAKTADSHIDYPVENLVGLPVDGDGYTTLTWYTPENLRKAADGITSTLSVYDRTLDKTDDQAVTYIEIGGTYDNGTNAKSVRYLFLMGDTEARTINDFNLRRNTTYNVTIDIDGYAAADHRIITVPFLNIVPAQTANSYLVQPGGGLKFPAKIKGNEATNTLATQSVGLLWQDAAGLVKSITYDSGTGQAAVILDYHPGSGNALVAAYDGPGSTGNILWSWHIWVTDYNPSEAGVAVRTINTPYAVTGGEVHTYGTQFQTANGTSRTIMDRNLGAIKGFTSSSPATPAEAAGTYGMMYQWGRKDPFPSATLALGSSTSIPLYNFAGTTIHAASAPAVTIGPVSTATSILNPTTIYTTIGVPGDWTSPQNNTLWLPTTKALYDPCPKGWRIPPINTWNDFTRTDATTGTFLWYNNNVLNTGAETADAQNGRRYSAGTVNAWYPTAGYRSFLDAGLYAVGTEGILWSGNTVGITANTFDFTVSTLGISGPSRGCSNSVRCVQE